MNDQSTLPLALVSWVREHIGLHVDIHNQDAITMAVRALADEAGVREDRYVSMLLAGQVDRQRFIDQATNHESFFLRYHKAMSLAVEKLVPDLMKRGVRPRFLSVPCAQGEEPYSLAMLLWDHGIDPKGVEIMGIDIAHSAIAAARNGVYGKNALRRTPEEFVARHFAPAEDGRLEINPAIQRAVDFRCMNLLRDAEQQLVPGYHIIFCNNLLIYFDSETAQRTLEVLDALLDRNGWLFVSPAEAPFALQHFQQAWIGGIAAFRHKAVEAQAERREDQGTGREPQTRTRTAAAETRQERGDRAASPAARQPQAARHTPRPTESEQAPSNPTAQAAEIAYRRKTFDEALDLYEQLLRDDPRWTAKALLGQARIYADEDDAMAALERADAALAEHASDQRYKLSLQEQGEAHAIIGLILRNKGLVAPARDHFAQVKSLHPAHPAARFAQSEMTDDA
ncbi:MAG: CheR family methyltransferase [Alphaproteobacteria bacterium]